MLNHSNGDNSIFNWTHIGERECLVYVEHAKAAAQLLSRRRGGASEPAANEHEAAAAPCSAARSEQR